MHWCPIQLSTKVYSSCGHTNSPLDVLFKLMAKYAINPKEIERIDVATYKVAFDLTSQLKTATEDEAKFSLPFCFRHFAAQRKRLLSKLLAGRANRRRST